MSDTINIYLGTPLFLLLCWGIGALIQSFSSNENHSKNNWETISEIILGAIALIVIGFLCKL